MANKGPVAMGMTQEDAWQANRRLRGHGPPNKLNHIRLPTLSPISQTLIEVHVNRLVYEAVLEGSYASGSDGGGATGLQRRAGLPRNHGTLLPGAP
jgi:hypothetical protein